MSATDQPGVGPGAALPGERARLRGFWSLFVTQFQGAFSDNVYKFLVALLIIAMDFPREQRQLLQSLVFGLFALPFVLFSMAGGFCADRFSKRRVAIAVKVAEILVMSIALAGFWLGNVWLLVAVVFLMSTQSAFFGPTKYGLLPELLPEKRLSWGNGVIGLGTYVAIISGTVVAGVLMKAFGRDQVWSGVVLVGLAGAGMLASLGITRLPAANPTKQLRVNFLGELFAQLRVLRKDRVLLLAVLGNNYLNFLGALMQPTILDYGKDALQLDEKSLSFVLLWTALAVGIGIGSVAAGYLSGNKIEYGLVPLGAIGITVFGALLGRPGLTYTTVMVCLSLLAFFSGFYRVPIDALIQHRPDRGNKGGIIATSAFLSWVAIFLAAGVYFLLARVAGLTPPQIFLVGALLTLAGTVYILILIPDALLRLSLWFLTHSVYRIKVEGRDHIPEKGGALFVCNHLSQVDALLLMASTDRRIRFLMHRDVYELPWVRPFARIMGVIPIASEQRPRELLQALQTASDAIRNGDVVCIFAEGQITRIGQLLPFRRGFERIMRDLDAPIVPVALDGVWGSIFSFAKGRFLWKLPRRIPYPVTVSFGAPLRPTADAIEVRQAVQELMTGAWQDRKRRMKPLHRAFVRAARVCPFRFAMADAQGGRVSFSAALTRAIFLARRLRQAWIGQRMVGLLLPPSVPGALVNFAALLMDKVPVNLNYTLSEEALASCIRQCELKTVLASRAFLDRLKLNLTGTRVSSPAGTPDGSGAQPSPAAAPARAAAAETAALVLLEDLAAKPRVREKTLALLMAWLLPAGLLERALGKAGRTALGAPSHAAGRTAVDDLATVIFSSGSTGEPKGVMLSHFNIASNVEQLGQTFAFDRRDRLLGVLPFFHSFGFTGTLMLPALLRAGVAYHANPLDAKTVGQLVREHRLTFLLSTPTFLQVYLRGCAPEEFGSLRLVMAGAEKLPERIAQAFEEKFGLRPVEGYGCTECAPVVTVNTRDFRAAGYRQVGAKRGTIGHPLPGISVRIVDATTFEPLPVGQAGLLLVKGPNVMRGYLNRPDKTAEVFHHGWYVTGDIAAMDGDGFITITDRMSRFSKIGGEMVPHIKVEETLHELAGVTEQAFVVCGVADEKKGERLVVLHTLSHEQLKALLEKLARSDLPNLWKPRADQFCRLEAFPPLGSGKLDLRELRELATRLSTASAPTDSPDAPPSQSG